MRARTKKRYYIKASKALDAIASNRQAYDEFCDYIERSFQRRSFGYHKFTNEHTLYGKAMALNDKINAVYTDKLHKMHLSVKLELFRLKIEYSMTLEECWRKLAIVTDRLGDKCRNTEDRMHYKHDLAPHYRCLCANHRHLAGLYSYHYKRLTHDNIVH
jgi:hypothetical protein